MTPEEERIFGIDHPVDVDGLGEFMKGMKIDLNGWKENKPKGIMFKHASSPAFQRLQNAIQKLAGAISAADSTVQIAEKAKFNSGTQAQLADKAPYTMIAHTQATGGQGKVEPLYGHNNYQG